MASSAQYPQYSGEIKGVVLLEEVLVGSLKVVSSVSKKIKVSLGIVFHWANLRMSL